VDLANSGTAAAQPAFQRGMALLHSFLSREARTAFQEAQRIDRGFAMAYWGEAMTTRDAAAIQAILRRAESVPADRVTERERAYLALLDRDPDDRLDVWREIHRRYPEDDDATLFLAWAELSQRYRLGDDAAASLAASMRAADLAEPVFARRPDHPGAAHYLLHAYDDSRLASRGLRAAQVYARIAPGAYHAVHMPSHIFFQFGMWDDVVRSNERAWALSKRSTDGGATPAPEWDLHSAEWLHYGLLQQGRLRRADALVDSLGEALEGGSADDAEYREHFLAELGARAALEGRRYTAELPTGRHPSESQFLAAALTALARKDTVMSAALVARGERFADSVQVWQQSPTRPDLPLLLQLRGLQSATSGRPGEAVLLLRQAADRAESGPGLFLAEGPQRANAGTMRLVLGDLLLATGDAAGALEAYDRALVLSPGRSAALLGRARALAALRRRADAGAAYARLLENWSQADPDLPGVAEARANASGTPR
jgi:hypothetical protein